MNRIALGFATAVALCSGDCAVAQGKDPLLGNYAGNMTVSTTTGPRTFAVELGIQELEEGRVRATVKRYTKDYCNGRYAMEGRYDDNVLTLKAKEGEGPRGCAIELTMTRDGNTLSGTIADGTPISLSK